MRLRGLVVVSAIAVACLAATVTTAAPAPAGTPSLEQRLLPPDNLRLPPSGAIRTPSGLRYVVLQRGKGSGRPNAASTVVIDYIGWDFKGRMFDSSVMRGEPASFRLNQVIAGWTEGVQLMVQGEKRRFWIPENLAYGGRPGAPQGMLVFEIELLEIQ